MRVSPYIGRVLRTFALTLGLAALMLQALAPLCLAGTASASSGQSIVICTLHGTQTIQLDADGNVIPNVPSHDQQNSTCSMCLGAQTARAFTAPAPASVPAPTISARVERSVAASITPSLPPHFSYVTRAPPASSLI